MTNVEKLKYWLCIIGIILVFLLGVYGFFASYISNIRAEFCGTIVSFEPRIEGGRRIKTIEYDTNILTESGKMIQLEMSQAQVYCYREGDYLVKIRWKKYPAVFRDGEQIIGKSFCYDKPVDIEEWVNKIYGAENSFSSSQSNDSSEGADAGILADGNKTRDGESAVEQTTAGQNTDENNISSSDNSGKTIAGDANSETTYQNPGGSQNPPNITTSASGANQTMGSDSEKAIQKTEEDALQLIKDASQLWKSGDKKGALKKSEEALSIRIKLYGENHPLVKTLQTQIDSAKKLI